MGNAAAKNINILLVEDDVINIEFVREMLLNDPRADFRVTEANSLAAAIEILQKDKFEVILLDLGLPDAQELNAFTRVYTESPGTPIVAVTALDDESLKNRFKKQGLQNYLIKGTFDGGVLAQTILSAIESKTQEKTDNVCAEMQARIKQLEESEKRYRAVFENFAIAITVADSNERIVSWNRAAEELFSMKVDDLYLKPLNSLYPEEEWQKIRSLKIREKGILQNLETVMLKNDGTRFDAKISVSILQDQDGSISGSIGIIRDISERKRAERILKDKARKSEIFFKLLRNLTPDISANEMLDFILQSAKALTRADTASIILLEDEQQKPRIAASLSSGLKIDGSLLQPSLDENKSITGWVIKSKQPLLLHGSIQNDERFRGIQWKEGIKCSINTPILLKDTVKGTLNLNITSSDYIFTEDDLEATVALATYAGISLEHSGLYKSMKDKYIEELKSSNNALKKINAALRETRSQLVQAEKMSGIGQLASGVAHEINNPLSGVLGNIQIIKMDLKAGGKVDDMEELLTTIEESAKRCKSITQNLLDFSRTKEGVFEPFDIHKALDSTAMLVGYSFKNAGIQIEKKYADGLPLAYGNANEMQQIFLNMFSNAKWAIEKSGSKEGTITIGTRKVNDAFIQVDFGDTGVGISKENMRKIFDAFYTTKEVGVGTGLGLSICYEIMQRNKGDLTVDSEEGKGTTFHVKLPVAPR